MGKIFANTICSLSENFVSKIAKHKLQATLDKIRKTTGVAVDKTDISFVIEGDWDNICLAHDSLEEIYKEEVACSNAFAAVTDDVLNSPRKYSEITNVISLAENKERKLEADAIDSCKYVGNSVTDELCNTQQETTKSSRSYMTEKFPDNNRQKNSNVSCFDVASAGEIINKSGQCQNDDTEVCSNEIKQEITPSHKNETVNIVDSTTGMFIAEIKIKEEPPDEIELHVDSSSYPVEGQLKEEKADVSDDENNKGCYSPSSVSAERGNNTEKELDKNHGSKFECEICSKKFGTQRDMKQHLHRIHTDQGYFCTFRLSNKHLHMCKDKQDETYQSRIFSCSDQEVNFTQNIKNLNTARKNNQCARQFHRWLNEAGDTRMMWNIPPTELDKLIGSFLLSIRKADGEEYEPDTLTSYHHGIERCLRDHDYPNDIVTDKEFAASRAALKSKRKELKAKGKGNKPNAAEPLSDGEEEILREKECIDDMDIGDSFELERHAGNFSVTHTQNTRLKKQHECGICGISVDTGFDLPKHHEEHSSADVEEKPSGFSVNFQHVTVSAAPHSDLITMTTGDRDLEISCTVDVITRQSKFSSGICEYSSKFKQNLKRHLKVHHELKKTLKSKSDYKVKKQKCRKNLRCHVCNYTTLYRFNLNRHVSQVHSDGQNNQRPTYKCKFCGKELHSRFAQKLHEDTVHTKIFKYTCPTCSKGFNQVIPYKGHLASHYDILKEKCDLCPASFNYKKSLAEHKQVIHEKRNFRCPQSACSAVYSSVRHLRDHTRAEHSNDRLPCDKCPKTFKWRSSLKYHKDTAH